MFFCLFFHLWPNQPWFQLFSQVLQAGDYWCSSSGHHYQLFCLEMTQIMIKIYSHFSIFKTKLKFISWYSEIWKYSWGGISIPSSAWKETGQNHQIDWYLLSEKGMTFCVYKFLLGAWNTSGQVGFNTGWYWYSLLWPSISLKWHVKKSPRRLWGRRGWDG